MELADEELADRPDSTLSSFSHATVSSSGPSCSQQAIPSPRRSWKRRLLFAAPLCLFAFLGVLAAVGSGTAAFGKKGSSAPAARGHRGDPFSRLAGFEPLSPVQSLRRAYPDQVKELLNVQEMMLKLNASSISQNLDSFVQIVHDSKRCEDFIDHQTFSAVRKSSGMTRVGGGNQGIYLGTDTNSRVRVVIKVQRWSFSLAKMYQMEARRQLINRLPANALGYLQVTFSCQNRRVFFVTQVMKRYGFCATCISKPDKRKGSMCPRQETREGKPIWAEYAFRVEQKAAIVLGTLRAILAMQAAGFLNHGDVKPLNILIPENALNMTPAQLADGTRLIDFDHATFDFPNLPNLPKRTLTFAPLEFLDWHQTQTHDAATGRQIYSRMDVFSCGMTLFELVYEPRDEEEIVEDMFAEERSILKRFAREFPGLKHIIRARGDGPTGVGFLLQGMLAPKWQDRWDTATAVERVQSFCCGEQ